MPIKESSDELNPAAARPAGEVAAPRKRSALDYVALAIATCGVGYFPIAPGTLGALVGVAIYVALWSWLYQLLEAYAFRNRRGLIEVFKTQLAVMLVLNLLITLAGIWAPSRSERAMQKKDPSIVVIDEVAGQMIALLSGPVWMHTWWSILSAFILFRLFDIWKPYPVRRLESLESGLGIMADDVLAGVYALIVNSILISAFVLAVR